MKQNKLTEVTEIYDKEIKKLRNPALWYNTLVQTSQYFKFSFVEAMLINAQVSDITTMATMANWNKYGRRILAHSVGIGVFTDRTNPKIKFLFDISQTAGKSILPRWELENNPTMQEKVRTRFNAKYGTDCENIEEVVDTVFSAAWNIERTEVAKLYEDFAECDRNAVQKIIENSARCITLARCGCKTDTSMFDFSSVADTIGISDNLLINIGTLAQETAKEALLEIECSIRRNDYETQSNWLGIRGTGRSNAAEIQAHEIAGRNEHYSSESDRHDERNQSESVGFNQSQRSVQQDMGRDRGESGLTDGEAEGGNQLGNDQSAQERYGTSVAGRTDSRGSRTSERGIYVSVGNGAEGNGIQKGHDVPRNEGVAAAVSEEEQQRLSNNDSLFSLIDDGEAAVLVLFSSTELFGNGEIIPFKEANDRMSQYNADGVGIINYMVFAKQDGEQWIVKSTCGLSANRHFSLCRQIEKDILDTAPSDTDLKFVELCKSLASEDENQLVLENDTEIAEQVEKEIDLSKLLTSKETDDALRFVLLQGSGFVNGKQRIFDYYSINNPKINDFASFLKKEYSNGGNTAQFERLSFYASDNQGLTLHFSNGADYTYPWTSVAKETAQLIENNQYLPEQSEQQKEQEQLLIQLQKKYSEYYAALEESNNEYDGYAAALDTGESYISQNTDLLQRLVSVRQDAFTSDREVAALAFALADCGVIEKFTETAEKNDSEVQEPVLAKETDNRTDLQKEADRIFNEKYADLSMQEKIDVIARCLGAKTGTIIISHCGGDWRGTSDVSIKFDNDNKLFIFNSLTPNAKKRTEQLKNIDNRLKEYNPDIVELTKSRAAEILREREVKDNAIAAERGHNPYKFLNVELAGVEEHEYIGWYYVTLAINGKIRSHLETGLAYDIKMGTLSPEPKTNYYPAGGIYDTDDYVFNGVGFSTQKDMYTLSMSIEARERAEKRLAELTETNEEAEIRFNSEEFEKLIPSNMRFKEVNLVNGNEIYWVTQDIFSPNDLKEFQQAIRNYDGNIKKFYVTPRDLSPHYTFEEDLTSKVLATVTPDEILQDDYIKAIEKSGLGIAFEAAESEENDPNATPIGDEVVAAPDISENQHKTTVVINAFGGAGAGKTTACLHIAAELKKRGYVAEYVPEYAKELVWDKNFELLDGSEKNQRIILNEQRKRLDRLIGQVDFVVTDAPLLLNGVYLKETDNKEEYCKKLLEDFNAYNNFNFVVQRDPANFEQEGRIHTLEESISVDAEVENLLKSNQLFFGKYDHSQLNIVVDNSVKTYQRLTSRKDPVASVNADAKPTITCEWSESAHFEDGKTYSVREFDEIMKRADTERIEGKKAALEKYGSWEKWYNSEDEEYSRFLGYDKTKFTINLPDGTTYTDRQDIGDGFGGVIDFLRSTDENELANILQKVAYGSETQTVTNEKNYVTLHKVGDFYELFGKDAEIGVEILSLHMTAKNGNPMVGFPAFALQKNAAKLEEAGYSVQIDDDYELNTSKSEAEQLERTETAEVISPVVNNVLPTQSNKPVDFHLNDGETVEYAQKAKDKFADNAAAIRTLKTVENEHRAATHEEQVVLSKYSGWGGLADAFDEKNTQWKQQYIELKSLLNDKEYNAALLSTRTSFYTDPNIIRQMYKALERWGFHGGEILDPSMGTGNFFAAMPQEMFENSNLYGVEIDSITGRIAKLLYPSANIQVRGYESTNFENEQFDVVISNVPFDSFKISDPDIEKGTSYTLHDYFFLKSIQKVKQGGIVAFITSSGTLDKSNVLVRQKLYENGADLIGAVRLPNNAFKTSGTEVTTDIVFLRKMKDGEPKEWFYRVPWLSTSSEKIDNVYVSYNNYFHANPSMILGVSGADRFENFDCKPKEGVDLYGEIEKALNTLTAEFTAIPTKVTAEDIEDSEEQDAAALDIPTDARRFAFYVNPDDGKLYYCEDTVMRLYEGKKTSDIERIKAMCKLCDRLQDVIDVQVKNYADEELKKAQEALTNDYDSFVKKYGFLNSQSNIKLFSADIRSSLLLSLERESANSSNTVKTYEKGDFFTKATIFVHPKATHVDTAEEALAISLNEKNTVDLEYIISLCGKDSNEVIQELGERIYQNPAKYNGSPFSGWETAEEYLSGNVKNKLAVAKQYATLDLDRFERNIAALLQHQPKRLTIAEIDFSIGAVYIPAQTYTDFMKDLFELSPYDEKHTVIYDDLLDKFIVTGKSNNGYYTASATYGTTRMNMFEILEETLNQKKAIVRDPYIAGVNEYGKDIIRYKINETETQVARDRQTKISIAFRDWVLAEDGRKQQIEDIYNERFNCYVNREYDGSHIHIDGLSVTEQLRSHQLDAVARIASGSCTMLAHEVGAGKTAVMAAAGMYLKQIGAINKPLYVVPKAVISQWGREFQRFFPTARILIAQEGDFSVGNRRKFMAKIAMSNVDAVIVTKEQFLKLPLSYSRQEGYLLDKKQTVLEAKRDIHRDRNGGRDFSVKQYADIIRQIDIKLERLKASYRKDGHFLTLEELGCDFLFVDEAHNYKNLFIVTKHTRVAGISTASSQAAFDMELKTRYMQEINNGGGVVMATGTPVSNSIAECYTFQHFLQPQILEEAGIRTFDQWASTFGDIIMSLEAKPTGDDYRMRERFAKFKNLPELCTMLSQTFDVIKTSAISEITLPVVYGGKPESIICEKSDEQDEQVKIGMERAQSIEEKRVDSSVDNMLAVCSYMSKCSVDPRLNDLTASDSEVLKVNQCVKNVIDIYNRYPDGTQIIFCDIGVPNNEGRFSVYEEIKKKLVSGGIFADEEVAFIQSAKTDTQKLKMCDQVNEGKIKVIIGSTSKLGTGINIQRHLVAAHHLDAPYVPKDIEQRNGRIIRQGNLNSEVHILYYSTKGTFDSYRWQILEKKQALISQILSGKPLGRSCEDIDETALTYSEMKAATANNPLIAEKMQIDNEVNRLKMLQNDWLRTKDRAKSEINFIPDIIKKHLTKIEKIKVDNQFYQTQKESYSDFSMTIGNQTYTERSRAGEAIISAWNNYHASEAYRNVKSFDIGKFRGFELALMQQFGTPIIWLKGESGLIYEKDFSLTPIGVCMRIENSLDRLTQDLKDEERLVDDLKKNLEVSKKQIDAPFEYDKELRELLIKQEQINNKLAFEPQKDVIFEESEDEKAPEDETAEI